mmetsp:Transcript_18779/g.26433  ORF Transcript_18779/g.26433 Transcript_18779/m.26433 type:complete len:147 (+) Transcript_18779:387-827(+)
MVAIRQLSFLRGQGVQRAGRSHHERREQGSRQPFALQLNCYGEEHVRKTGAGPQQAPSHRGRQQQHTLTAYEILSLYAVKSGARLRLGGNVNSVSAWVACSSCSKPDLARAESHQAYTRTMHGESREHTIAFAASKVRIVRRHHKC